MNIKGTRQWLSQEIENVASFWLENGIDEVNGGVYTCLDKDGKFFSTDKSVWMQGRCGWIFAYLCRVCGVREEWLKASKSYIDPASAILLSALFLSQTPSALEALGAVLIIGAAFVGEVRFKGKRNKEII